MVIQSQDTSEGCKLEHATETAEVMLMEIFLLLIITCSIPSQSFCAQAVSSKNLTILSTCPPKQSKGYPHSVLILILFAFQSIKSVNG